VLHLLANEPPSVGQHNGDVACRKHVNLGRKIGVSNMFDWHSPGVCLFILVIGSSPTRWYKYFILSLLTAN